MTWYYQSCCITSVFRGWTLLNSSEDSSAAKPMTNWSPHKCFPSVDLLGDVLLCLTRHSALKKEEKIADSDVDSDQASVTCPEELSSD